MKISASLKEGLETVHKNFQTNPSINLRFMAKKPKLVSTGTKGQAKNENFLTLSPFFPAKTQNLASY